MNLSELFILKNVEKACTVNNNLCSISDARQLGLFQAPVCYYFASLIFVKQWMYSLDNNRYPIISRNALGSNPIAKTVISWTISITERTNNIL